MDAWRRHAPAVRRQAQALGPLLARPQPEVHEYDLVEPSAEILILLDEIDRDPTCTFWG
jgi:hypothetical protein